MNERNLLEFSKVFHNRLGQEVYLSYDILNNILDILINNYEKCEYCLKIKEKYIVFNNKNLGYNKVCNECWKDKFINWSDEYYY